MKKAEYTQLRDVGDELETARLLQGLESEDARVDEVSRVKRGSLVRMGMVAVALTAVAALVLSAHPSGVDMSTGPALAVQLDAKHLQFEADKLGFKVFDAYGEAKYGSEHPFIGSRYVAEPFKAATFTASGDIAERATSLVWVFDEDPTSQVFGKSAKVTFIETGAHKVKLVALDKSGKPMGTHESEVFTAYVRRELRKLNDPDRKAFLDAASLIWRVSTTDGQAQFGPDYVGMDKFVQVHADQATGDILCDKWHEGTGFLTHHLALSLAFEKSLRAVNKQLTTPYWDFTIDGELIKKAGGGPSMLTEVNDFFTDKWFGSVDSDSHVQDGAWAHADAFPYSGGILQNSYGMIRAPWNNNGDTELTRHMSDVCGMEPLNKPVPSCQVHAMLINNTMLSNILMTIAGWGHGTMHVNTGGVFGECTQAMSDLYAKHDNLMSTQVSMKTLSAQVKDKFGVDPEWEEENKFPLKTFVQDAFHLEYFHIYRTLYRSQMCALDGMPKALQCPEHCDFDVKPEDCKCECAGVHDEDFDWQNIEPCMYMQDKTKWIAQSALTEDFRKDLVKTFCSAGVIEGEQLESASPIDPVFWMIHPILDKLIMAKRLASQPGGIRMGSYGKITPFEDESWLEYSSYTNGEYTCPGHGADDEALEGLHILPRVEALADTNGDGKVSNIELYNVMDPTKFNVDYVYDEYGWTHCGMENDLDLAELMVLQSTSYASKTLEQLRANSDKIPSIVDTAKGGKSAPPPN